MKWRASKHCATPNISSSASPISAFGSSCHQIWACSGAAGTAINTDHGAVQGRVDGGVGGARAAAPGQACPASATTWPAWSSTHSLRPGRPASRAQAATRCCSASSRISTDTSPR